MKNFTAFLFLVSLIILHACNQEKKESFTKISADGKMLDSIRSHSDSTYVKPYKRTDFVTAEYIVSKKDSSITQVMKDSASMIRQIIIEKNKRRIYLADFYSNGQLVCKVDLDDYGQYHGPAAEYYPTGAIKRSGVYIHGLHSGKWKNFDDKGNYTLTDEYNHDGQQVKSYKE